MSCFAPIWNPADSREMLVFGIAVNKHLNLRTCDASKTQMAEISDPTNPSAMGAGPLLVPSALVSLKYLKMPRVYGVVNLPVKDDPTSFNKTLCLLSPVFQTVFGLTTSSGNLAGVGDGSETGYLYYVDFDQIIREQSLKGGASSKINQDVKIKTGTCIAACLGTDQTRYVAYQLNSGFIQVYNVRKNASLDQPSGSSEATDKGPIAIVQYKGEDGKSYLNLYYTRGSDGAIKRNQRIDDGEWGKDAILTDVGVPAQTSTLSATFDPGVEKGKVILTFKNNSDDVVCVRDQLP